MRASLVLIAALIALSSPLAARGQDAAESEAPPVEPQDAPAMEESGAQRPTVDDSEDPWLPGAGEETAETRVGADFRGMGFLFPVRLHLTRGGHVDGKLAGVDSEGAEFMLMLPRTQFRVSNSLVRAVTPRSRLPEPGSIAAQRQPPPLVSAETVYKLKPTWRSGLGLALNALAPGTGSFIQREDKTLGFLFLGMDIFFLTAGSLAAFAPSNLSTRERAFFGGIFFAFDGLTRVVGATQAFAAGRERTLVPVRVPGATTGPGLAP